MVLKTMSAGQGTTRPPWQQQERVSLPAGRVGTLTPWHLRSLGPVLP